MPKNKILLVILVLQICLIFVLGSKDSNFSAREASSNFLELDFDSVNKIFISNKTSSVDLLKRPDQKWIIDGSEFPIDSEKVKNTIKKLGELKKSLPAATTLIGAKQLGTTEESYEKKLELKRDGKVLYTVYLGDIPSFKKVYARVEGVNDTYILDLDSYSILAESKDWAAKDLLNIEENKIKQVSFSSFSISKVGEDFEVENLAENEETKKQAIKEFISKIIKLNYEPVPSREKPKDFDKFKMISEFSVITDKGESAYKIYSGSGETDYYLTHSEYPFYFQIKKPLAEYFSSIGRGSVVAEKVIEEVEKES